LQETQNEEFLKVISAGTYSQLQMNFKQLLGTAITLITIMYNTIISRTAK